jgi:hypothetical protein
MLAVIGSPASLPPRNKSRRTAISAPASSGRSGTSKHAGACDQRRKQGVEVAHWLVIGVCSTTTRSRIGAWISTLCSGRSEHRSDLAPSIGPNSPAKLCVALLPQPQLSLLTVEKGYSRLIPAPTADSGDSICNSRPQRVSAHRSTANPGRRSTIVCTGLVAASGSQNLNDCCQSDPAVRARLQAARLARGAKP